MSIDPGSIKLVLSGVSLLKSALSPDEKARLEYKILDAIENAKEKFYQKYGEMYGSDVNSFLVNRENEEVILNSIFYSAKLLESSDICPQGFDGILSASPEAIDDFLNFLNAEIRKDFDLDGHFKKKELLLESLQIREIATELKNHSSAHDNIQGSIDVLSQGVINSPGEITNYAEALIDKNHQHQINYSRNLIHQKEIQAALKYLEWVKQEIWSTASSLAKFRIITNIGAAYMALGEKTRAARHLIQALQYNPDDELATCNAAQAFLALSDIDNARIQAEKTLELNPSNATAYSVLVQLGQDVQNLDELIQRTPVHFLDSPEIAFAISIQYRKRDDFDNAKAWLERAIEHDTKEWSDLRAALGGILIEKAMTEAEKWGYESESLPECTRDNAKKGIVLLTEAWEQVANTDVAQAHSDWLYNRSLGFFLLGQLAEAICDVEGALLIKNEDVIYLKILARYTLLNGDDSKTLEILEKIKDSPEVPEALLLKVEVLKKSDIGAAERELLNIFNSSAFSQANLELQRIGRRVFIQVYLKQEKFEEARKFLTESKKNDPDYCLYTVDWSKIDRLEKKETGSSDALKALVNSLPDSLSPQIIITIADELYVRELFELASSLYERLVTVPGDNWLTESLLISYYRAGLQKQALELSLSIIDSQRSVRLATNIACAILLEIGDLPKARELYSKYLVDHPDDYDIALRRALLDYRNRDSNNLREFLSQDIRPNLLNIQDGVIVAQLLLHDGQVHKGLDLLYELRRKFYSTAEIHGAYLASLYALVPEKEPWLHPKTVTKGAAVYIKDETGSESWYIIEDREDVDISKREIPLNHHLTLKLLNKKIGTKFLLSESRFAPRYGQIKAITSKYIYALQDSQAAIGKIFESVPGVESIHLGSETNKDSSVLVNGIKELATNKADTANNIVQEYSAGRLSLGSAAEIAHVPVIDIWIDLIKRKDVGIKCFSGDSQEFTKASIALSNAKTFVLDLSSILTMHVLKLDRALLKASKHLVVARSTLDELYKTIERAEHNQCRRSLTIRKDGGNFVKREVTGAEKKQTLAYLNGLVNWCLKNCDIVPCYEALEMESQERIGLVSILNKCFADSLLIAKQEERVLISDDQVLRLVASEYKIASVWSHALVNWLLENMFISKKDYNKASIQLIQMQYKYTPVNRDIVIESAELAKWNTTSPFAEVIEVLRGGNSEMHTACTVSIEAISDIWIQAIDLGKKEALIEALLREILTSREKSEWGLFVLISEEMLIFRPNLRDTLRKITLQIIKKYNSTSIDDKIQM